MANRAFRIDAYRFGEIVINGVHHKNDVIIFPHRVKTNWWREDGHSLSLNDLEEVIDAEPEVLIIGQGANGRMHIPESTVNALQDLGIQIVPLLTDVACEEYNRRAGDPQVIAALHLTC